MGIDLYSVPILFAVALTGVMLFALPAPSLAGKLLQVGSLSDSIARTMTRRRASPMTAYLIAIAGVLLGLAVGAMMHGLIGPQGWALGGLVALGGFLAPNFLFVNGWDKRFVNQVNADVLPLMRMVYILSGVGRMPVDEAIRSFAQAQARHSAMADLLMECPPSDSAVNYLRGLDIPGDAYLSAVMTLTQAVGVSDKEGQRKRILAHHVQVAVANLKNRMESLAKQRAQTAIVLGVLILLPTLMVTVLAPPFVSMMALMGGKL
jgi:hypothetical protein